MAALQVIAYAASRRDVRGHGRDQGLRALDVSHASGSGAAGTKPANGRWPILTDYAIATA